jgi:PIN domain nuclease of toxin-antitoxin system
LLLDTHVIVWAVADVQRLDSRVATLLADSGNELWMSAVSAWELAMLTERRRVTLLPDVGRWLESAAAGLGLHEAPLTSAIALDSRRLAVSTDDPADRFIAATARAHGCTLVTADVALRRIPGQRVVFCRPRRRRRTRPASSSADRD